jgi:hypothetical protein
MFKYGLVSVFGEVERGMEAEMLEVIRYIQERSENLRRYSRKLREAISIIESQFGERNRCRVCRLCTRVEGEKRLVYANAAISGLKVFDPKAQPLVNKFVEHDELFSEKYLDILEYKYRKPHKFVPCVDVDIDVDDTEPFYVNEYGQKYFLAFRNSELVCIVDEWNGERHKDYKALSDLGRDALKDLIKSKRLIKFLEYVAEELRKREQDFREVSEIAEKMALALAE